MRNSLLVTRHASLKNEQGFVLVMALLALLVVTVLGVLALSTSTTEVMISGNSRLREINLSTADAVIALTDPVMRNPDISKYNFVTDYLREEIYCRRIMDPDTQNYSLSIGGNTVTMDIDLVNVGELGAGYALEGGGPPIVLKHYVLNSTSTAGLGSENRLGAVYYLVGYCE